MRVSRFAFLLLAATSAAAASDPPQQKGGEWQSVQLGDRGIGSNDIGIQCFATQSILAKFKSMPHCSRKDVHTNGDTTTADARCRFEGSVMRWHEKVVRFDDDNFNRDIHVTFSPPVIVYSLLGTPETTIKQSEIVGSAHLKWLGACRPGERPLKF